MDNVWSIEVFMFCVERDYRMISSEVISLLVIGTKNLYIPI